MEVENALPTCGFTRALRIIESVEIVNRHSYVLNRDKTFTST
jgi:hypothetical protein